MEAEAEAYANVIKVIKTLSVYFWLLRSQALVWTYVIMVRATTLTTFLVFRRNDHDYNYQMFVIVLVGDIFITVVLITATYMKKLYYCYGCGVTALIGNFIIANTMLMSSWRMYYDEFWTCVTLALIIETSMHLYVITLIVRSDLMEIKTKGLNTNDKNEDAERGESAPKVQISETGQQNAAVTIELNNVSENKDKANNLDKEDDDVRILDSQKMTLSVVDENESA